MSPESRYRRLLRLLPAWYRDRYEDEMVEVHRASGAPLGAGEIAATVRLAVGTRARAVGRPGVRTLWLVTVAVVAALATNATWGLWTYVDSRFLTRRGGWTLDPDGRLVTVLGADAGLPDLVGASRLYQMLWVVVLALLLAGLRRTGLAAAAVVTILDVSAGLGPLLDRDSVFLEAALARTDARTVLLPLVAVGALALIPGSRGTAPGAGGRTAAAGLTVTSLVLTAGTMVVLRTPVGDGTMWSIVVPAVVLASLGVLLLCRRVDPAWPATVLTLAALTVVAGPLPHAPLVREGPIAGVMVWAVGAVLVSGAAWIAATGRRAPEHVTGGTSRRRAVAG